MEQLGATVQETQYIHNCSLCILFIMPYIIFYVICKLSQINHIALLVFSLKYEIHYQSNEYC